MNKQSVQGMFNYFRMVFGVTRRLIDQFPADKMNYKPTPEQRTVAETVCHVYAFLLEAMETVQDGAVKKPQEPTIADKAELLAYMDSQVEKTYAILDSLTEEQLAKVISAYGHDTPAWKFLTYAYDEHWHHRGALTVYLRLLGIEPIMVYDYEN